MVLTLKAPPVPRHPFKNLKKNTALIQHEHGKRAPNPSLKVKYFEFIARSLIAIHVIPQVTTCK